ncbi:FACT complex subunit SPT16 [Forsythia ovata]|uniref:FACT complex subunit n=1 Tax=Forsythia ovata TaxID=205694 RepID=A0ABD1TMZ4_9LAMI
MAEKPIANGPPRKGNAGRGSEYTIDLNTFSQHLQALYTHWHQNKDELWGSANVLAIATPPPSEDLRYLKSSSLNIWLLGYEFPEMVMVFGSQEYSFSMQSKESILA